VTFLRHQREEKDCWRVLGGNLHWFFIISQVVHQEFKKIM